MEAALCSELLKAKDYRDFLARAFAVVSKQPRFSYASFARKAGFASRSFPRDVVQGSKRLTLDSSARFSDALALTGDLRDFFLSLVAREEGDAKARANHEQKVQLLRRRLKSKLLRKSLATSKFYFFKDTLEVYASLGTQDSGATLAEIQKRSGLTPQRCQQALDRMNQLGVMVVRPPRYYPVYPHLVFDKLGGEVPFKRWFLDSLLQAHQRASKQFRTEQALFFNSVFSVSKSRMPEFKARLREMALSFVDESEDASGDAIARINISFYSNAP